MWEGEESKSLSRKSRCDLWWQVAGINCEKIVESLAGKHSTHHTMETTVNYAKSH